MHLNTKIMEALIPGPDLDDELFQQLKAYASSKDNFMQTLGELQQEGFVQSKKCVKPEAPTANFLYALTEKGASHLVETEPSYKNNVIRTCLSSANTVEEEMGVTAIVKTLRWEMSRRLYDAVYYDASSSSQNEQILGLTVRIPDILLEISDVKNQPARHIVAIELDLGSRGLPDLIMAVLLRECQTLFLCNTIERIHELRDELTFYDHLHGMVYFAVLSVFCSRPGGVFSIDWINLRGETISLYPAM